MDSHAVFEMFQDGALTTYPLTVCSILVVAIALERYWRYRGMERRSRELTREVVEALSRRDISAAKDLSGKAATPLGEIFQDGLAWKNIALEDLERILTTSRHESLSEMRRGLWILGTIGSLAPFVGLFGTVVGIMKSFHQIAIQGSGGFEVVSAGISEALIATAVGLGVAIVALAFYNYLQVRVGQIGNTFTRACERLVQSLLYVEAAGSGEMTDEPSPEVGHGHHQPA